MSHFVTSGWFWQWRLILFNLHDMVCAMVPDMVCERVCDMVCDILFDMVCDMFSYRVCDMVCAIVCAMVCDLLFEMFCATALGPFFSHESNMRQEHLLRVVVVFPLVWRRPLMLKGVIILNIYILFRC